MMHGQKNIKSKTKFNTKNS